MPSEHVLEDVAEFKSSNAFEASQSARLSELELLIIERCTDSGVLELHWTFGVVYYDPPSAKRGV
jgi:hypothetical protein